MGDRQGRLALEAEKRLTAGIGSVGIPRSTATNADATALGAVLVIAPLLLGWTMGWALRPVIQRFEGWRRHVVAVLAASVPLAVALPVAGAIPAVGSWDVVAVFFWIALALLLSSEHVPGRSSRAALVVIPLTTLVMLEIASRVVLPKAPPFPPARKARLVVSFATRDPPCEAIFPDATGFIEERTHDAGDRPVRVVHVGDSMVWGNGVSRDEAFPSLLEKLQPGVAHINSGTPAAGPDADLIIARQWIEHEHVDLTIVYFFMGNDVQDIDRAYTCCGMGPLLDWHGAEPRPRCTDLEWTFPVGVLLSDSPPPYPLRVASGWSSFAAHATAGVDNLNRAILSEQLFDVNFGTWHVVPMEERFAKVERILRLLRDEFRAAKAPLLLVVLPYRETLERANGLPPSAHDVWNTLEEGRAGHRRVVAIARGLGIDVLDAWPPFDEAVGREGAAKWFAHDYPGDVHFSAAGHRLFANWLAPQLEQRGIGGAVPAQPPAAGRGGDAAVAARGLGRGLTAPRARKTVSTTGAPSGTSVFE